MNFRVSFLLILLLVATIWRGAGNGRGRLNGRTPAGSRPLTYISATNERRLLRWDDGDTMHGAHRTGTQRAGSAGRTQPAHWLRQKLDESRGRAPGAGRPDRKS